MIKIDNASHRAQHTAQQWCCDMEGLAVAASIVAIIKLASRWCQPAISTVQPRKTQRRTLLMLSTSLATSKAISTTYVCSSRMTVAWVTHDCHSSTASRVLSTAANQLFKLSPKISESLLQIQILLKSNLLLKRG